MKAFYVILLTALALPLVSCKKKTPAEKMGDGIEKDAEETGDAVKEAAEEIKEAAEEAKQQG